MATQLIQAAQQALEALHEAVAFREGGRQKAIDAINALRTAIQQATQPAEVTGLLEAFDDAVSQELLRVSHVEYDSHEICKHFASKVRAILALRPVQVPMTDEVKVTSYSEWRRGDVLRITREGCDIGPFSVGQLVRHDDEDGDNVPYCLSLDGHDYYALIHDQLEFVSREAPHGITAQAKKEKP